MGTFALELLLAIADGWPYEFYFLVIFLPCCFNILVTILYRLFCTSITLMLAL